MGHVLKTIHIVVSSITIVTKIVSYIVCILFSFMLPDYLGSHQIIFMPEHVYQIKICDCLSENPYQYFEKYHLIFKNSI